MARRRAKLTTKDLLRFVANNEGTALLGWRCNPERLVDAGLIVGHRFFPDGGSMPPAYSECKLTDAGRAALGGDQTC
jgi:hypothetical protein